MKIVYRSAAVYSKSETFHKVNPQGLFTSIEFHLIRRNADVHDKQMKKRKKVRSKI